ncbi:hypothetical protein [Dactylosporangium sp. NPDC005555]|uniref:hypothetical protein n=1 Tax=Dactylosporangium sp. NPDC005555 TaxID=3154889 RepID=UPI0033BBA550
MRMRWALAGVVVMVAAFLVGCGSSNTTGDACAEVRKTLTYYLTDSPEIKAVTAEVEKGYYGTGEPGKLKSAKDAYNKALGNALRPIVDKAKTPELKAAIADAADAYSEGNDDVEALQAVYKLCPQQP